MNSQTTFSAKQEIDNFRLPSERLVHRFPCAAPIAALEAMSATTKLLIRSEYPSMQELMDIIEEGDIVPAHLFMAHGIVDDLDRLRISIHLFLKQISLRPEQSDFDDIPF
jgi:hypothetical protein